MSSTRYIISAVTSDFFNAGTDGSVYLTLLGSLGRRELVLDSRSINNLKAFQAGQEDIFCVSSDDVGYISNIKIRPKDSKRPWHLKKISVRDEQKKRLFVFSHNGWLFQNQREQELVLRDDDRDADDFFNSVGAGRTKYVVEVFTSAISISAIQSPVYLTLIGLNTTNDFCLNDTTFNNDAATTLFLPGQKTNYSFISQYLGYIGMIKLRHAQRTHAATWHLDKIVVTDERGRSYTFTSNEWLFKEKREHEIKVDVIHSHKDAPHSGRLNPYNARSDIQLGYTSTSTYDVIEDTMAEDFVVDDAYYSRASNFFAKNDSDDDFVGDVGRTPKPADPPKPPPPKTPQVRETFVLERLKTEEQMKLNENMKKEASFEDKRFSEKMKKELSFDDKKKTNSTKVSKESSFEKKKNMKAKKETSFETKRNSPKTEKTKEDVNSKQNASQKGSDNKKVDATLTHGEQIIAKVKKKTDTLDDAESDELTLADGEEFFAKAKKQSVERMVCSLDISPLMKENSVQHNTHKFKTKKKPHPPLILRRGQSFKLVITNVEPTVPTPAYSFTLSSGTGPLDENIITVPRYTHREYGRLKVTKDKWGYQMVTDEKARDVTVEIYIPPTAVPNKYQLCVTDANTSHTIGTLQCPLFILFNPWCEDDEVYMKEKSKIREYVMKQNGTIYVGTSQDPRPSKWYYGQFEEVCLEAAFSMLSGMTTNLSSHTAVDVCRHIGNKVSSEGHGMVSGGGTSTCGTSTCSKSSSSGGCGNSKRATAWSSTPSILETFIKHSKPAKWDQCYVYSAVLTSILRTLGIPTRCVTIFNCGHGCREDLTIQKFLDKDGHVMPSMTRDTVWTFYVWNEVWMERKDLSDRFGGWQALVVKPAEKKKAQICAGPASVEAIKIGDMSCAHDTGFVFSHVNADTVYKQENKQKQWEVIKRSVDLVGQRISTKAVGSDAREDITNEYKFHQGSILESSTVKKHFQTSIEEPRRTTPEDIRLEMSAEKGTISVGEDVLVNVTIVNTSNEDLELVLVFGGVVVRYNGNIRVSLRKHSEKLTATANGTVEVSLMVSVAQYLPYLEEDTMIQFAVAATVPKTSQVVTSEQMISIKKPSLTLSRVPQQFILNTTYVIMIEFNNPLDKTLTDCHLSIDGSIIDESILITELGEIPPKSSFKHTVKVTPNVGFEGKDVSRKSLVVSLSSKEFGVVSETLKVQVKKDGVLHQHIK